MDLYLHLHFCISIRICISIYISVFQYVFAFVFVFVFIFVFEYVFASVFWTLLYIGELEIKCTTAVVSSKWRSSELHFWTFHFSAFRPQTFSAFQPQNFSHIFNRKFFLSVSNAELFSGFHWCISSPKSQFVFAKNAFYLKLELASPLIPCRFCQLKKVFDLGEMMLRRHFCAARKKFKSRWSSAISHHSQKTIMVIIMAGVCIFQSFCYSSRGDFSQSCRPNSRKLLRNSIK